MVASSTSGRLGPTDPSSYAVTGENNSQDWRYYRDLTYFAFPEQMRSVKSISILTGRLTLKKKHWADGLPIVSKCWRRVSGIL